MVPDVFMRLCVCACFSCVHEYACGFNNCTMQCYMSTRVHCMTHTLADRCSHTQADVTIDNCIHRQLLVWIDGCSKNTSLLTCRQILTYSYAFTLVRTHTHIIICRRRRASSQACMHTLQVFEFIQVTHLATIPCFDDVCIYSLIHQSIYYYLYMRGEHCLLFHTHIHIFKHG